MMHAAFAACHVGGSGGGWCAPGPAVLPTEWLRKHVLRQSDARAGYRQR